MIITTAQKCDIERFLKGGSILCYMGMSAACIWTLCLLFGKSGSLSFEKQNASMNKMVAHTKYIYPLDAIGSGPLALYPRIACGWVSRIVQELSVVSFNSRPDVLQKEAKILVCAKESLEQSVLSNAKTIFLQECTEGKGLQVSESPTALWIKPILLDNGNVLVEAGRKLISKEGHLIGEEKSEFIAVPTKGAIFKGQESQMSYVTELKAAHYLGQDPLFVKYGGKEYASWRDKIKIEFTTDARTYACFLSAGDLLQYKDREWRLVGMQALDPHLPLAKVLSCSAKSVDMQVWDESGFFSAHIQIADAKSPSSPPSSDLLPSALRMRSNVQVSCMLGKKRLLLKKGDWVLRTSSGWRTLKRANEIEDYLYHRLKGELFIFDSIDQKEGKCMLKGHFFDAPRTLATAITLPIDTEKKRGQKSGKKSKFFSLFGSKKMAVL